MGFEILADDWHSERTLAIRRAIEMLQAHLAFVYAAASEVRAGGAEPDAGAAEAFVAEARAVVASGIEALDIVGILGEAHALDEATARPEPDSDLLDVVIIARMSLRSRAAALDALRPGATAVERLGAVDGAMRAVQKSASAVERFLAASAGLPAQTDFHAENVAASLEIRRQYVRFHEAVTHAGTPSPEELAKRLRSAGNAVAWLFGRLTPLPMRAADRAVLELFQDRIRDYLTRPEDDAQGVLGQRLWQDIASGSTMLLGVHKREEIVLYDLHAVETAMASLDLAEAEGAPVVDRVAAQLADIKGRSPELDALLERPLEEIDRDALRAVLESIAASIGHRGVPHEMDQSQVSGIHFI